ncbi:Y-family DNA polymerase [Peribacillus asahii]|uniref:Y-family DNA polymerase n=1 Tax=Peribacillus asahii TaxID=228899 RepID=UPI00207A0414|nr:Y-family DNA polymerase [Peribacillus asahii]USK62171.1 Y-family DNA polymerase [Peribacillus asahii]
MVRPLIDYSQVPSGDILAVDVKSFFASVESVKRGLHPLHSYVIVLSGKDRTSGMVLASSPLVKAEFGIKTGSRAFEIPRDPKLIIVEPRMSLYLKVNGLINDIFRTFVANEDLHSYSIDESLLDIQKSKRLFGDAKSIARQIQTEIWKQLKLVVTIGIGDNPLLAKLAMDNEAKKSPKGMAEWRYHDVPNTVWKIPKITDMWGIGQKTAQSLNNIGIYSVYDLAHARLDVLKKKFGVLGEQIYYHAHGIDYSVIRERYVPMSKSYGKSQILMRDYIKQNEIEIVIREMADQVAARLRAANVECSVVHLSVGFSRDFPEKGFSHQVQVFPTSSSKQIIETCIKLFRNYYVDEPVRSIAISCGKVRERNFQQLNLFESPEKSIANEKLEKIIDNVRNRYGYASLIHASSLMRGGTAISRSNLLGGHKS